jgi:defect-in-organelle-trafficking protein DotD
MKKVNLLLFTLVFCALTGCASYSDNEGPQAKRLDPATTQLAEAATSVDHTLVTLQGIRKAEHPQWQKQLPNTYKGKLGNQASIDWTGPIGPLTKKIAQAAGYHYSVLGQAPAIPIIIKIHARDQTLGHILRNADYQAGRHAYIKVYGEEKVLELRYPEAAGDGETS